ncbi:Acyl carrier protein [Balamuthia mandrillaris]
MNRLPATTTMLRSSLPALRPMLRPSYSLTLRSAALYHTRSPFASLSSSNSSSSSLFSSFHDQKRSYGGGAAPLTEADVSERVLNVVRNFHKVKGEVNPKSHFVNDLGLDSLDTVELVLAIEDEFAIEIPEAEADKMQTCQDAVNYLLTNPHAK